MRLLALDLLAYGPFTGTRLDFAAGQQGLHLVYGPNEAGKSSALRALTALLYGFEPQNRDNFIHQYKDLRVGGTLLHTTGERIEVIRRKGQKNTLLDEAGQPLGETALDRFLGGASKELFRTLFGIDHVQLLAGGQEILAGGGQVGAALFAAGTGFVGLRQLAEKLRGEALDLFKPRGQNQTINALIKQHGEVRRVRDAQVLRGADWQHHDQALRDAQARRRTVLATLQARQAEQAHLERIRQALPHIARRGDLLAALQELADAVLLPTDFSARRIQSFERLEGVRRQVQALEQELERIETEHTGLTLDHGLLERGGEIQRLVRGSDAFAKAIADLTKLRVQANDKERSVRTLAREIRPDLTPERIEIELDVPKVQRDGIRELGNQHGALLARRSEALRELEQLKTELAKKRQTLAELGAAAETSALQRAIERVQRSGDLDGNLASVNKKLALEQAQATAELHRLGGWDGELEALERLTLPTLETVDAFHDRFTDLAQRQAALAGRLEATRTAVAESRRQLDTLRLAGAVPDEQALQQARTQRDSGWQLVRQAWLQGQRDTAAEQAFNPDLPLPDAYEQSVLRTDELADRLRREASRVQQQATAQAALEQQQAEIAHLEQARADLEQQRAEQEQAWQGLWEAQGVVGLTPKEMRTWLGQAGKLLERAARIREYRLEQTDIRSRQETCFSELGMALEGLTGETPTTEGLDARLDRARTIVQQHDALRTQRHQLATAIADLERRTQDAEQRAAGAAQALQTWQQRWIAAIAVLGLGADATPTQANLVLGQIEDLRKTLEDAARLRDNIATRERERTHFVHTVHTLCEQIAPDLGDLDPLPATEALHARLQEASKVATRRDALDKKARESREQLAQARLDRQQAEERLDTCLREAGCTQYAQLQEVEDRSARRRELERALQECRDRLIELSGGRGETALLEEAAQVDADTLPLRHATLVTEIQELEDERSQLDQTIGREQTELKGMDGGDAAAAQAEVLEQTLAALRTAGERYLRLRLASAVLEQQIESYRQKHQTPLLRLASDVFARLTLEAFSGLEATFTSTDQQELRGVRADGRQASVADMSDGTRDQLFLALRLASIQTYLEGAEPMPLVVDDILINYDDTRSLATLQALADLSQGTQVVFFTHHRHLVELARTALAPEVLFVQELNA